MNSFNTQSVQANTPNLLTANQSKFNRPKSALQKFEKSEEQQRLYDYILKNIKQLSSKEELEKQFQQYSQYDSQYLNSEIRSIDSGEISSLDSNDYLNRMQQNQQQSLLKLRYQIANQRKIASIQKSQIDLENLLQQSQKKQISCQNSFLTKLPKTFKVLGVKQKLQRRRNSLDNDVQTKKQQDRIVLNQQIQTSLLENKQDSCQISKEAKKQDTDQFYESAEYTQDPLDPKFQTQQTDQQNQSNQCISQENEAYIISEPQVQKEHKQENEDQSKTISNKDKMKQEQKKAIIDNKESSNNLAQ